MDLNIVGKTAVVTGASRGIGLAVARALTREGVRVVGAARSITPQLSEVTVATVAADLATPAAAAAVVDTALSNLGGRRSQRSRSSGVSGRHPGAVWNRLPQDRGA
jgi:NAD(P)-dependent dehydrogenase (short-subunit alcohol dehydrogenase family)